MENRVLVIRVGELFLKGKNRYIFINKLTENLNRAIKPVEGAILRKYHGRYLVEGFSDIEEASKAVLRVFGISSISSAVIIEPSIEAAQRVALEMVNCLEKLPATFCVRAKRSDKKFPITSTDIGRLVGETIWESKKIPVDLKHAEYVIDVEIGPEISFVYTTKQKAAGGLPVGTSGHVEMLLSGGIDSPVAAWLMMKRGVSLSAVTFYSPPWVSEVSKEKVIKLAELLHEWGGPRNLHIVKFGQAQKILRAQEPAKLAVILYRRLMLKVAARFAVMDGAIGIATGDSLGQVASQTIQNLAATEEISPLPVFRPLLTYDKNETIELSEKLGFFETSIIPHEDSCSLFIPKKPETKARIRDIQYAERNLDLDEMAEELIKNSETITFK
jgi:tRNA uracil 4-sulfurtransferase